MGRPRSNKEKFWKNVLKTNKCWIWKRSVDRDGYGLYKLSNEVRAHRIAWVLNNGSIPRGKCVLHRCDNPTCVKPMHLWIGTTQDNSKDMTNKGRSTRGSRNGNSKLIEKDVIEIRELYSSGKLSQEHIARKFRMKQPQICQIILRNFWTHI